MSFNHTNLTKLKSHLSLLFEKNAMLIKKPLLSTFHKIKISRLNIY